ncbi:type I-E CRISPR-associated protein Cas6/Cse3/CasE [Amycolatopsis sp. FDAARGOS 1241]|uniref:type I-E CRISPR-associated protein Cas6/Cse3/CasE n=1 Tax=Amycolatopsis sp. FDAARGOS 1241 TaxID=2778070 RepID=UPI0019503765|nr:type I-E CRISPR-associated protein Cas6/Cse3/CasE [Amycolatopsis sp. FDAARGOS 1241]QRP46029.1 type I-E CRISPR-associated protein Cas6/Cse3/CasE [Amycolatopsis sp. FDAARGOS 1241]
MFLTKMPINPQRRGAQQLLSSPQAMHAAVLAGFPDARPTEDGRVLWRLDTYAHHRVLLFIASPDKPDLQHLVEQAGWPTTQAWQTASYDGMLASLRTGQRWQFRLTANPVRAGRRDGWDDTKPLGHVTVAQQQQWLLDRTERLGFRFCRSHGNPSEPDLAVIDRTVRRFRRGSSRVTISTATFEGHLEILDALSIQRALTFGIGRAKSYGCGLMTLARPAASTP